MSTDWDKLVQLSTDEFSVVSREKIRKSVPMASHTKARNTAILEQIKFGASEVAFSDVAPNRFFRDWNYWWWRGYFAVE